MLILGRYTGQAIIVNDDILIHILDVRGNSVKLGFTAPKDITIYREEIYKQVLEQRAHMDLHLEEVSKLKFNH